MRALPVVLLALPLAACMAAPPQGELPPPRLEGGCDAVPASGLVGQKASSQTGARALDLTGARTLRWGPPDSMWTMDYRRDRVNVRYDAAMVITAVTCG